MLALEELSNRTDAINDPSPQTKNRKLNDRKLKTIKIGAPLE